MTLIISWVNVLLKLKNLMIATMATIIDNIKDFNHSDYPCYPETSQKVSAQFDWSFNSEEFINSKQLQQNRVIHNNLTSYFQV